MQPVWQASLKDDITAVSSRMAFSLKALDSTASSLFKKSDGNFAKFKSDMKKMGVDATDATLITERYRKELIATRRELLGLGNDAKNTSRSMKEIATGALRGIGEKALNVPGALLGGAVNAVTAIGEKVFDVGKDLVGAVIDAAQFRQNAITGLEYMLGTREEAVKIFKEAQDLASETPLDTDKVITGIKQLVTAGFSGKEAMVLFKSVADQASKFADDEGMQDKVIAAFSRVKGRGVATGEDLESFRVAGFRAEGIVDALLNNPNLAPLFKKVKVSGIAGGKSRWVDRSKAENEDILKQVKEVMGEGKIGTYTLLNAVIASAEKDKPEIGEFAKKMGKVSLTGTISNFKSAFGDLLKSIDLDKWPGVVSFQNFLTRVSDALKGDVGKQLLGTIEKIMNSLLGGLDKIGASDIDGFVKRLSSLGESAVDIIKKAWEWLDKLLHSEPGALIDSLADVLVDVGALIGEGILKGFKAAAAGGSLADERFIQRHGVSKSHAEEKAASMGVPFADFMKMYSSADKQFKAAGMADTVIAQSGESAGEAYMRRVLEYNAMLTEQARSQETFDIGSAAIKSLNIPKLASGGIVTAPTLAWVGEAGPEAVVPLRTMAGTSEDSIARFGESGTTTAAANGLRGGGGGIGTLNLSVNVGSVAGGDPTATANAIADITIERLMLAVMERKRDEG